MLRLKFLGVPAGQLIVLRKSVGLKEHLVAQLLVAHCIFVKSLCSFSSLRVGKRSRSG